MTMSATGVAEFHENCAIMLTLPNPFCGCAGKIGKFGRGLSAFAGEGGGRMFVQLAALAGCDYVDNVRGLGLMSALPIVTRFRSVPADCRVKRILMHLHKTGKTVSARGILAMPDPSVDQNKFTMRWPHRNISLCLIEGNEVVETATAASNVLLFCVVYCLEIFVS